MSAFLGPSGFFFFCVVALTCSTEAFGSFSPGNRRGGAQILGIARVLVASTGWWSLVPCFSPVDVAKRETDSNPQLQHTDNKWSMFPVCRVVIGGRGVLILTTSANSQIDGPTTTHRGRPVVHVFDGSHVRVCGTCSRCRVFGSSREQSVVFYCTTRLPSTTTTDVDSRFATLAHTRQIVEWFSILGNIGSGHSKSRLKCVGLPLFWVSTHLPPMTNQIRQ